MDYTLANELLVKQVHGIDCEMIGIENAYGRVLGEDFVANENVPFFARSPYDGYAFRAADTRDCKEGRSVMLEVIDNIRAGEVSAGTVVPGTAIRLMTGAPVPEGADAICKFEDTIYTDTRVMISRVYQSGENVVAIGEDIKKGTVLAKKGSLIDPGLIGTFASLGITECRVYKKLKVGLFSTGDEVISIEELLSPGKVRNSNRYIIGAALERAGMETVYIGHAADDVGDLCRLIKAGESMCDVIISTGGVSVGDYDLVPEAMLQAGYEVFVRGVDIKPGMACAYGVKGDRLMLALSGNPASALTNLECVCLPALKKMAGFTEYQHTAIKMTLEDELQKGANGIRFVRGRLEYEDGRTVLKASSEQGNTVISSAIGTNAYGIIKDRQGPIPAGTLLDGFVLQ